MIDAMILRLALAMLVTAPGSALAAPPQATAFRALYEAGKQSAGAALVSVLGKNGATQPASWLFLYADASARGGVREVVVRDGAVESVRTPLRGYAGFSERPKIPLDKLAVDSDRAFLLANEAAIRARVGFDAVNYQLEAQPDGEPVWTLELLPVGGGSPIGRVKISAATGEVQTGGLFSSSSESGPLHRIEEDARFLLTGFQTEIRNFFERLANRVRELTGTTAEERGL